MATRYSLTQDPVYYSTLGIFAVVVTLIPTILGQARFLPVLQAIFLTGFIWLPVRQRDLRAALSALALWFALQFAVIFAFSWISPTLMERIFVDGLVVQSTILEWQLGQTAFPGSIVGGLSTRLIELVSVTAGALLTAGLIGYWRLAGAVNLIAFQMGTLTSLLPETGANPLIALHFWSILRVASYTILVALCSMPIVARSRRLSTLIAEYKPYWLAAALMLVASLLSEAFIAGWWRALFG